MATINKIISTFRIARKNFSIGWTFKDAKFVLDFTEAKSEELPSRSSIVNSTLRYSIVISKLHIYFFLWWKIGSAHGSGCSIPHISPYDVEAYSAVIIYSSNNLLQDSL